MVSELKNIFRKLRWEKQTWSIGMQMADAKYTKVFAGYLILSIPKSSFIEHYLDQIKVADRIYINNDGCEIRYYFSASNEKELDRKMEAKKRKITKLIEKRESIAEEDMAKEIEM
ncbi:hypothetical protein J7L85_00580 [candidate division WOR-3 bacterium]|nr:hypothetical protein [candidate division WOR-3 bacterium]